MTRTAFTVPVVFVSSTCLDLSRERSAAFLSLAQRGIFPAGMEQFGADEVPVDVITESIKNASEIWCIVGMRFGCSWSPTERDRSWVMKEVQIAREHGKRIVFFVQDESAAPPLVGQTVQQTNQQKNFRSDIALRTVKQFRSHEEFLNRVENSVQELRALAPRGLILAANHPVASAGLSRERFYQDLRIAATNSYFVVGMGLSSVSKQSEEHLASLRKGMRVRFLMQDPLLSRKTALRKAFDELYRGESVADLVKGTVQRLSLMIAEAERRNLPGSVEVRSHNKLATFNFTAIDEALPNARFIVEAVMYKQRRVRWMDVTRDHALFDEAMGSAEELWGDARRLMAYNT